MMAGEALVAILRSRSGDQQHRGERSRAGGNRQRCRECDAGVRVVERDRFFAVGVRLRRILRPLGLRRRRSRPTSQYQRDTPATCDHEPSIVVPSALTVPSYVPLTAPTFKVSDVPVSATEVIGIPRAP